MAVIRVYGFCEEGKGLRVLQQVLFCLLGLGNVGWYRIGFESGGFHLSPKDLTV